VLNEPELAMGKGTHWLVVITQQAGLKKRAARILPYQLGMARYLILTTRNY